MGKIVLIPKSISELNIDVDGFIIGLKDYSVNMNLYVDICDLDSLDYNKEIFIAINKNMENIDIDNLRSILEKLNNYNIKGILIYDVGILNMCKSLNLNYDLILSQEHLSTNYKTISFYEKHGINGVYLSSDITLDEINNITKNIKSYSMANVFGYLPMFVSKRHIVKNYLNNFNISDNSNVNYIEKEGNVYPIIDNHLGTVCYGSNILNGIKESLSMNVEYKVINSFNIDNIEEVIELFKNVNKNNIEENFTKLNSMFTNIDNGFLNRKTIYKVKHEK